MQVRGRFITFEGIDGSGKTTQMRMLAARLRERGLEVLETVEPGGTAIGNQVRRILLDSANHDLRPTAELLLYFASRAQNVEECIRPAIAAGKIVLCDRFTDSTVAYQGYARGLGADTVWTLDRIACQGLEPDLTLLVDVDLDAGLARMRARNVSERASETRMDEQSFEFHRKVRDAYMALAKEHAARFRVIDGRSDPQTVAAKVWEAVAPHV